MNSKEITPKDLSGHDDAEDASPASFNVEDNELSGISPIPNTTEKPVYKNPVLLRIEGAQVRKSEPKTDTNGRTYIPYRIVVRYSDQSSEGLSGLRVYVDEHGKPTSVWDGPTSAYGEIKQRLESFLEAERKLTPEEFRNELIGKMCRVRTEKRMMGKQEFFKNLPMEFVKQ